MICSAQLEAILLSELLKTWKIFVSELSLFFEPANAIIELEAFGQTHSKSFADFSAPLIADTTFARTTEFEDGMNSPGVLWDRLTILSCKSMFTSPDSVHHKPSLHKNLGCVELELSCVARALARALPARNILLAKEATERQQEIVPLEKSLWNLQTANIAMWINQDLLYTVTADDVSAQRLRDYIVFFSKANRVRNIAIENIEHFYSNKMRIV